MSVRPFDRFMVDVELASNAKFARLKDSEKLCVLLGVWPLAAKAEPRGYLVVAGQPATEADVAHHARCSIAVARATLARMRELRMLELGDGLEYCHDWHDYNPDPTRDRTNAERQRRHRAKKRTEATSSSDAVADDPRNAGSNTFVNASVTPLRNAMSRVTAVTEGELELEPEPSPKVVRAVATTESWPPEEARPSSAREEAQPPAARLARHQLEELFAHWADSCRPGSDVELTENRKKAARSRASRDGFTFEQLMEAVDGAATALEQQMLEHDHRDTEFKRIFVDREHVEAWIAYNRDGDEVDLMQALVDREEVVVGLKLRKAQARLGDLDLDNPFTVDPQRQRVPIVAEPAAGPQLSSPESPIDITATVVDDDAGEHQQFVAWWETNHPTLGKLDAWKLWSDQQPVVA
jgi:hypothetical protein